MIGTIRDLKRQARIWLEELQTLDNKAPATLGLAYLLDRIPALREYLETRFRSDEVHRLDLIATEVASFVSEWGYERKGTHRTRTDVVNCCVYHFERKGLSVTSKGDEPGPGVLIWRKEIARELDEQILGRPGVGFGLPNEKEVQNKSYLGFSLRSSVPRKTSKSKSDT